MFKMPPNDGMRYTWDSYIGKWVCQERDGVKDNHV